MCNLSQGILERGVRQGQAEGIEQGMKQGMKQGRRQGITEMILSMYKNDISLEQIANISNESIETVQAIINGEK